MAGSVVKSAGCCFGGPRLDPHHLHGGSKMSVTPVLRESDFLFSSVWAVQACDSQIYVQAKPIHMK